MPKKIILSILLALVAFTAKAQTVYVYSNADDGFLNIHFSLDAMPAYKELLADDSANTCIPLSYENLFDSITLAMALFAVGYPFFFTRPSNTFFMASEKVLEGFPARIP